MRTMHLFAGIGGGMLADLILGHTPVVAIEKNPYCCEVLRHRKKIWFPELEIIQADVQSIDPERFKGKVDVLAAGFPCQSFSINGNRRGFDDPRGQMFFEVIRYARILRPRFICLENVPAILVSGFETILESLAKIGYDVKWHCLSAGAIGAPHIRNRWWALAYPNGKFGKANECGSVPIQKRQHHRLFVEEGIPWTAECMPHPVLDGFPERLAYDNKAVEAYGNAQIPLQAAIAFAMLGYPINF